MRTRVTLVGLGLGVAISLPARAQQACERLTELKLARASITSAATVPAGKFAPPDGPTPSMAMDLPAYCKVQGVARPSDDSEIHFEVWLPLRANWNGKFEQIGNGGYAGSINPGGLAAGVARGYVTAATDNGHIGPTPTFAIGHPEKVVDFGHRAVHETAVQGKEILQGFYGKGPSLSYFFGCSDGGREALMEAQRYPLDFNGIIVGAPANSWTRLLTAGVWNWKALTETPANAIPITKLPVIQRAVVAACDELDGVKDGLIEDPRRCHFDPAQLRCPGADGPNCLTPGQVEALSKIYQGPKNPRTGEQIYAGTVPGTEAVTGNWDLWITGGASPMGLPFQGWFGTTFYANMVFEDAKWDYRTFDFDRDLGTALRKSAPALDSNDPDLRPFRDHGGKLIQYHGWGDAAIPAFGSIEYYDRVKAAVGSTNGKAIADFYRLFMVPGMSHCAGGIGPNDFGNLGLVGPSSNNPDRDVHAALVRWVEKGVAPEWIIAKGTRPGDPPVDPTKAVPMTRLLCPYPRTPRYKGTGNTDDAASFSCS